MAISAKVQNNSTTVKAKVTPQDKLLVTNYTINASTIRLNELFDVNATNPLDGSMLIYNGSTTNWEATIRLDNNNQIISGGNY